MTAVRDAPPARLWWLRHAESQGNVADWEAREAGAERLELAHRDPDMPLSERGRQQAEALGAAWRDLPSRRRPVLALTSPYARAVETTDLAVGAARWDVEVRRDERLRERDLGVLDGYTREGILAHFPQEAERRSWLGKFYYRPPGGESWADVAGRVRSVLTDLDRRCAGQHVLLVTHQAVVLLARYVLEGLTEQQILDVDRHEQLANTALTCHAFEHDAWRLTGFNDTSHLESRAAPVTDEPDATTVAH